MMGKITNMFIPSIQTRKQKTLFTHGGNRLLVATDGWRDGAGGMGSSIFIPFRRRGGQNKTQFIRNTKQKCSLSVDLKSAGDLVRFQYVGMT